MTKVRTSSERSFELVLGHEDRIVVEGCGKFTLFSYPSTTQAPNHKKITVIFLFLDCTAVFRSASSSPKQHPVGLGELIPERKFHLFKRGVKIIWWNNWKYIFDDKTYVQKVKLFELKLIFQICLSKYFRNFKIISQFRHQKWIARTRSFISRG